jgi:hypothetical protein
MQSGRSNHRIRSRSHSETSTCAPTSMVSPFIIIASRVVSPSSFGEPPHPTLPSQRSCSHSRQPCRERGEGLRHWHCKTTRSAAGRTFSTASRVEASGCCVRVRKATRVALTNGQVLMTMGNAGAPDKWISEAEAGAVEKLARAAAPVHAATSRDQMETRMNSLLAMLKNAQLNNCRL